MSSSTKLIVWTRSAGICSAPGCRQVLHRDPFLFKAARFGHLAHNVAASAKGPRGDAIRSKVLVDDPENLIMMCPTCHKLVDDGGAAEYPEELLQQWKQDHEQSIELFASVGGDKLAGLLICTGKIRGVSNSVTDATVLKAAARAGYRPLSKPRRIGLFDGNSADGSPEWWKGQLFQLRREVDQALEAFKGNDYTMAVFAVAEMPALIALGFLLGDEQGVIPFQYDRTANSYTFTAPSEPPIKFTTTFPDTISPDGVALVISVTAPIDHNRVVSALGGRSLSIVEIRAEDTGRLIVRTPATVAAFKRAVIECVDRIEALAGHKVPISVFPAMPAPLAVALGTTIMPKAPVKLIVFDSDGPAAEFRPAITLP